MEIITKYNRLTWAIFSLKRRVRKYLTAASVGGGIIESHKAIYKLNQHVKGKDNHIIIEEGCVLDNVTIHIVGNNNVIKFGKNVHVGKGCSFWMEGNNCKITIGEGTTFTLKVHFNAQEDNSEITCGKDCMFSNTIIVRTSDSHAIIDAESGERLNPANNISIGDHVWIAPSTTIMKGANIGPNTIIGSHTLVTKAIPSNVLAVGMPARVVKEKVTWSREDIIFHKNK